MITIFFNERCLGVANYKQNNNKTIKHVFNLS